MKTQVLDRPLKSHQPAAGHRDRGKMRKTHTPGRVEMGRLHPETSAMLEPNRSEFRTTRDLIEIQTWAEKRGGMPATVVGATSEDEANLWIEFPGSIEAKDLELTNWEDWYQKFLDKDLIFEYQERTEDGKESQSFRLIPNS